jgi:hypothetical protein
VIDIELASLMEAYEKTTRIRLRNENSLYKKANTDKQPLQHGEGSKGQNGVSQALPDLGVNSGTGQGSTHNAENQGPEENIFLRVSKHFNNDNLQEANELLIYDLMNTITGRDSANKAIKALEQPLGTDSKLKNDLREIIMNPITDITTRLVVQGLYNIVQLADTENKNKFIQLYYKTIGDEALNQENEFNEIVIRSMQEKPVTGIVGKIINPFKYLFKRNLNK